MAGEETFGRALLLDELAAVLAEGQSCLLLTGPSGIGKSALIRALSSRLRDARPDLITVRHEIASPVVSLDAVLGDGAAQIADQAPLTALTGGTGHALLRALRDHPFAVATAALLDVAGHLLPGGKKAAEAAATALVAELSVGRAETIANELVAAGRKDLLGGMFALLEVLATNGFRGVLLLDALDQGSVAVNGAIATLLRRTPAGWTVIAAVNDETEQGVAAFNAVWPEAAAAGVRRVALDALDLAGLESWTRAIRGDVPERDVLQLVLSNCGGRPLYLVDWVEERSLEAERGSVMSRLGPYYDARLRALSESARRLVRQLSLLPPGWTFPFTLCTALLGTSEIEALSVVDDLVASHFLEPVAPGQGGSYRYVHEVAHLQVRASLPPAVESESARVLLTALETVPDLSLAGRYARLGVASRAGEGSLLISEGVATAQALTEAGSARPADEVFRMTLAAARSAGELTQEAEARLGIAQVLLDTGFYEESLRTLETVEADALGRPGRHELVRGQVLIRLNRYELARVALTSAAEAFVGTGDEAGELAALREENTILRDLERYDEAVVHARRVLARAHEGPLLIQAASHRALARSLALAGTGQDGLGHAQAALELATASGSARAAGNAHLAAGECLRHIGRLDEAIDEYEAAIKIAEALANRDSLLWGQLGLADALLLANRLEQALTVVEEVGGIIGDDSSRYPLEFLHLRLSRAVLEFVSGSGDPTSVERAADDYESLGIRWPALYVERLIRQGAVPGPKNL